MRSLLLPLFFALMLSACSSVPAVDGAREPALAASAEAWYRHGNALVAEDRWETAVAAYRQALERDPAHARARHNLGLVHLHLGVVNLLEARRSLPEVDAEAAATMRYLACLMESFMGHPRPPTCEEPGSAP